MSPLEFALTLLGISVGAGFLGSLVGLGGGVVVVPALTLLYGIDIRYAIGASIVSVIATSSGAAAAYVRDRYALDLPEEELLYLMVHVNRLRHRDVPAQ